MCTRGNCPPDVPGCGKGCQPRMLARLPLVAVARPLQVKLNCFPRLKASGPVPLCLCKEHCACMWLLAALAPAATPCP